MLFAAIIAFNAILYAKREKVLDDFPIAPVKLQDILEKQNVSSRIFAPGAIRSDTLPARNDLTRSGVFTQTNSQREQSGAAPLTENHLLNKAAEYKLSDMFFNQYFAHVSPLNEYGPSDWVEKTGYAYRLVGENLALGGFENDADLIRAWMDSPGHRANILNKDFTEIGIAVGKDTFEGQKTWLAVQVFANPLPTCPSPNEAIKNQIESSSQFIGSLSEQIKELSNKLVVLKKTNRPLYNQKVNEYNALIEQYNDLASRQKENIKRYNDQVNQYNACVII